MKGRSTAGATIKLYCAIDKKLIPMERILQRSGTCGKDCQKKLRKIRLAIIESRKCLHCFKPSTPEERRLYRLFKAHLVQSGTIPAPKRGRTPQKAADGIPQGILKRVLNSKNPRSGLKTWVSALLLPF